MCTTKKPPHIHAEFIKAWADGAEIEYFSKVSNRWCLAITPNWHFDYDFRIKPEPKPDVVSYTRVIGKEKWRRPEIRLTSSHNWNESQQPSYCYPANVKFTFDGETGLLKDVSLIKE